MASSIVFTFIGSDKPGLIESLSNTVSQHGGNWLESRMSHLAGQFAGITRIQISDNNVQALTDALLAMSGKDLIITVQTSKEAEQTTGRQAVYLSIIGNDRPGIVKEVSSALAAKHINVYEMETNVTSAPMTAEPLFEANAIIQVPAQLALHELADRLDEISNELAIDINLEQRDEPGY